MAAKPLGVDASIARSESDSNPGHQQGHDQDAEDECEPLVAAQPAQDRSGTQRFSTSGAAAAGRMAVADGGRACGGGRGGFGLAFHAWGTVRASGFGC